MFTRKVVEPPPLSHSKYLLDYFTERGHERGLLDVDDDRDLGRLFRATAVTCATGHTEIGTELRLRHYVMSPADATVGMKVVTTLPLAPEHGVICEVTDETVTVDFSTEQTVDCHGDRTVTYNADVLAAGALLTAENLITDDSDD